MTLRPATEEIDLRSLSTEGRELLMLQAAKGYYDLDRTMAQIATQLGLTRWQVARLLKDAREQGMVRIEIVPRALRRPDLESTLQKAYELREAIVVPDGGTDADDEAGFAADGVAQAAAQFLSALAPRPALVGVSWGRTMAAVAHWLPHRWNDGVEVVLLNGATHLHATASRTNNVAELFATAGNGRATLLPVPAIVGRAETRTVLEQDPLIAAVLQLGREAPVACFGLGGLSPDSVLVQSGSITVAEVERLRGEGAVGDVLGRFIDAGGAVVDPQLDARTVGLPVAALREKAVSVGVAAGGRKHAVVLAALRARLVNVLVTDERTATMAIAAANGKAARRG